MSDEHQPSPISNRVRRLAAFFVETDLLRLRIERDGDEIELGRQVLHRDPLPEFPADLIDEPAPVRLDTIKADLVGVFRLARPAMAEGDLLESDRELAFVEALGIRNPVRSLGPGRIVTIACHDGDPVEYGQVLFEIDRG